MRFLLATCLAVARISAAPPLEKLTNISEEKTVTTNESTTAITTETPKAEETTDTTDDEPIGPIRLTGKERKSLIGHINLNTAQNLVLTPRQQMAVTQELEYQELGLQPFSDPTPWQRLTREEQQTFNNVYLALPADIQEFSKIQFLTVPDDIKEHAFRMFLNLDVETLIYVIGKELQNEPKIGQQQPMNEAKQYTEDDELPITNEQLLEKEHVEKYQDISSEEEKENKHKEENKEIVVDEGEVVNEEIELEGEHEIMEENKVEKILEVKEEEKEEEEKIQELEQTVYEEQGSGEQEDQIKEDEKVEGDKEELKEVIQIKKEEFSSDKNVDSAPVESSTQPIKQKHIQNDKNFREVAIERLNKEIANSPDFSFEELGVPFLPRKQEAKKKINIQYQARRQFVEKRKQILTEHPRGSIGRRQPLEKQSRVSLRSNIDRRSRLPQRRFNLIDPRKQRQRS